MARFADIPKFIHGGGYTVNVSFSQLKRWLKDQEEGGQLLNMDPDYQRGHVWTPSQQSKFVEYVLRGGTSSRDIYWNHPCYIGPGEPHRDLPATLELVDGKQRVTAVLAFLDDQIPVFGHLLSEFDDPDDRRCALGLGGSSLIMHVNNLQTRAEVLTWYLDLNDGGVVHTSEEIERVKALLEAEKRETP